MNVVAGVAIALAQGDGCQNFANTRRPACATRARWPRCCWREASPLVTGGTDNHLMVLDVVKSFGIDGRDAERVLDEIGLATNKQVIPDDPNPPMRRAAYGSERRLHLARPGEETCVSSPSCIADALASPRDARRLAELHAAMKELSAALPPCIGIDA